MPPCDPAAALQACWLLSAVLQLQGPVSEDQRDEEVGHGVGELHLGGERREGRGAPSMPPCFQRLAQRVSAGPVSDLLRTGAVHGNG